MNIIINANLLFCLLLNPITAGMPQDLVLNPIHNAGMSPSRQKQNLSPSKEIKKLKFELSDCVFELRKQQEDFAEARAHLIIAHNQQKKALNLKIRQLNNKIAEDNEQWTIKIDEVKKQCKLTIAEHDSQWAQELDSRVNQKVEAIVHQQYEEVLESRNQESEKLKAHISELTNKNAKEADQIQSSYINQLENIKKAYETQLKDLKENLEKQQQDTVSQMTQQIVQHQNNYLKAQAELQKLRNNKQQKYSGYEEMIKGRDKVIESLKSNLEAMKQENQVLKQQLSECSRKLNRNLNMTEEEYGRKLKQVDKDWREKFEQSNQKWKEECTKLQNNLERIQGAYRERQRICEEQAQKVLNLFDSREAREEDVKLIENLQIQLIKKDFQLQREKQQLKSAKLELENMDDIYKRIFYSASHHSHSSAKNQKYSTSFHLKKVRLPGIGNRSTHPIKNLPDGS